VIVLESLSVEGGLEVLQGEDIVENVSIGDGGALGECSGRSNGEGGKSRSSSSSGELHSVGVVKLLFGLWMRKKNVM